MLQWIASCHHNSGAARPELLHQIIMTIISGMMSCIASRHIKYIAGNSYDECNVSAQDGTS